MAYTKKAVSQATVQRANALRALPLLKALEAVGAYAKLDASYEPAKNRNSSRYHVSVNSHDYELLICQEKWYDTRACKGGGGAIDLAMHLFAEPFGKAFRRLDKAVTQ